jgi:RNA polymerase sigma-70 factor, ECF subfamily
VAARIPNGRRLTVRNGRIGGWTNGDVLEWRVTVIRPPASSGALTPLEGLDDGALVDACRAGRRDAFDLIVGRHQRAVYQICYRFVGNHADASDLTQDAFLRAWRGLAGFKRESSVRTWLYRIAVNTCLNRLAVKVPPMRDVDGLALVDHASEGAAASVLRAERAARVRRAIMDLPDKQRATVILRIYQDLPHQQIAELLGNSVGSVKANLFHALKNLRRLLGGDR